MSFIENLIEDIKNAEEFTDAEKDELIAMVQEAWDTGAGVMVSLSGQRPKLVRLCPTDKYPTWTMEVCN